MLLQRKIRSVINRIKILPEWKKDRIVKKYARRFSIKVFIETGTYDGHMVDAVKDLFSKIYSVELNKELYEISKKKFSKFSHISINHGDSSEALPKILAHIREPCLFWLDAHYSYGITSKGKRETPIMDELHSILNHAVEDHVILIDDARLYAGSGEWPPIKELRSVVFKRHPSWVFEIKKDIVRIHKRRKFI